MYNIVLARIDDRLIHGQVMTAWVRITSANKIIIVDDKVASDTFLEEVIKRAAPTEIVIEIYGVERGAEVLISDGKPNEKIILLAKNPQTILSLIEKGVTLKKLNIGGMGAMIGRKPLYKNISASIEERECLKRILKNNVKISIQIIPDQKSVDLKNLLSNKREVM